MLEAGTQAGQVCSRLQSEVTFYSLSQKFCPSFQLIAINHTSLESENKSGEEKQIWI
jgi:hypothetical protein